AADAFVVRWQDPHGAGRPDVVAGYPWFGTWSRDAMTSYPGLFLATGRAQEGRALLTGYAATLSGGMLAHTADTGELRSNSAVDRHVEATGDPALAATLAPALRQVITAHLRGVRYGIRATVDGLLTQGAPGEALTWMDARVDGVPVTPRAGKAVEVNALWINGLATVAGLCEQLGREASRVRDLERRARSSFPGTFLRGGRCDDLVGDPALRPNQLLAVS